ncbi:MAG: response regulator [Deltaproteobacteria bacterium]|nr:response regulator [Deltaproteobacteria bacterium]MBW1856716.1 response regulator [Deltaproteobacteria bacterium]MBW2001487.1 response regulator [Deltaproteobacteria bacterium]
MKILVIDDEPVILNSCRKVLEEDGFDVYLVPSADEALKAMKKEVFNLLLVDVKMPKHDGIYLMQKVKEKWPDVPIIVMSGYPTPDTITDGAKMGADAFIAKPFTPDELLETIRQVIQKEEGHGKK